MKHNNVNELVDKIIKNDFCSGCGVCATIKDSPLTMSLDQRGKYRPVCDSININNEVDVLSVCPFYNDSINEDVIGESLFGNTNGIKHNEYMGYYLKSFAGYVRVGNYREDGSSGGVGSWITNKLMELNIVNAVIHVKQVKDSVGKVLFNYQVSKNTVELSEGGKSKYYPIEMSEVIDYVKKNEGNYALVGVPCFIKAIRLLAEKDEIIKERIKFTVGLVCGHLKSDKFAKSIAWQMGITENDLSSIDFRVKIKDRPSSDYGIRVEGNINGTIVSKESPTRELYTTNWGEGMFKYKVCDFCDDVLSETADITIGDAWIPEYKNDSMGTNIIVVRNPIIMNIINECKEELYLDELSCEKVFESQAGGFRHRREGLSYRLYLKDKKNEWRPKKRVNANNALSRKRKKIYENRIRIYEESFNGYELAKNKGSFDEFTSYMAPIINEYKKLNYGSYFIRGIRKIQRIINRN